ncbi:MAG: aminoglycoside 6-adenylyltransferase [Anaerolineae bacterium]|nr:aminoglycoside 6-adenylyltransferase [Anaerolineae bacterium]
MRQFTSRLRMGSRGAGDADQIVQRHPQIALKEGAMTAEAFFAAFQERFLAWAGGVESIRLILRVGSRARAVHPGDADSDLDLELFGEGIDGAAIQAWLRGHAPLWMMLERQEHHSREWLALYAGGYKVDVSISPLADLETIIGSGGLWSSQQRGYAVLLDRDRYAERLPPPAAMGISAGAVPDAAAYRETVDEFWYGAVYVAKQIKRGKLWKAKWADQMQQRSLLTMLEWQAQAIHPGGIDTWHNGDFMQEWVSADIWERLHGVFARFDAEDCWRALAASMRLFDELARQVAQAHGYVYPAQMAEAVAAYVEQGSGVGD